MIKINVSNDLIVIKGHSGYSVSGSDIVCASISCIAITSVNAILKIDENAIFYKKEDGYLEVRINKHTEIIDLLIDNMIELFSDLEKQYKKYIKINKEVNL